MRDCMLCSCFDMLILRFKWFYAFLQFLYCPYRRHTGLWPTGGQAWGWGERAGRGGGDGADRAGMQRSGQAAQAGSQVYLRPLWISRPCDLSYSIWVNFSSIFVHYCSKLLHMCQNTTKYLEISIDLSLTCVPVTSA
jgi:hypothetical protein